MAFSICCSDPVEDSLSAETKNFRASEEIPTPDKSEELADVKQGVEDVFAHASPAESTPSSESDIVEASILETASAEVGPPQSPSLVAGPVEVESIPSSEESSVAVANQPSGTIYIPNPKCVTVHLVLGVTQ